MSSLAGQGARSVVWGRADDGMWARVIMPHGSEVRLDEAWPPMGLARLAAGKVEVPDLDFDVSPDVDGTWARVESELGLFAAERLAGLVAVHAAVIRDGSTVLVLPGSSYSGKTSLCVAALESGMQVLSDEYALVDPASGLVRGWPRPLKVRLPEGGWRRAPAVTGHDYVKPSLLAFVTYEQTSEHADVQFLDLSSAEVAAMLLRHTVCARSRPEVSFEAALTVARSTAGVTGVRGEAHDALVTLMNKARS